MDGSARDATQEDQDVVVPPLEQHLSLEVQESVLASAQQQSNYFVRDGDVDREDVAKGDDPAVRRLAPVGPDDAAQLFDLLVHVQVRLDPSRLRQGALRWSAVPVAPV